MSLVFTFLGASLGAAVGASLELTGHDKVTCVAAVVAAQVAYVLTWLLVQEKLKHRRLLKTAAAPPA